MPILLRLLLMLPLLCPPAMAGQMRLSAMGQWGADTPASLQSGPGALFAFQFELPQSPPPGPLVAAGFVYALEQINRPLGLSELWLAPASAGGMFDMALSDGATLSLYGAALAPTGLVDPGQFGFTVTLGGQNGGGQSGGGVASVSAVPEPAALALLVPAVLLLAVGRLLRAI